FVRIGGERPARTAANLALHLWTRACVDDGTSLALMHRRATPVRGLQRRSPMDYLKPAEVVSAMVEAGKRKAALSVSDLLVRGALSGAILGIATQLAVTAAVQTGVPLAGALIFPVGFTMIVLLNLELVTGSFAVLPMAQMDNGIRLADTLRNWI